MEWIYKGQLLDESTLDKYVGFVYIITNNTNQKKYIGKKLLKRKRTKQIKGKKKHFLVDSDWKVYYGSNRELNVDVIQLGEKYFTREILRLCSSKGECNYFEAKYQFEHDVLERDDYYNSWITVKVSKSHLLKLQHII